MYEDFEARRMARRRFLRRNLGWIAPLGVAAAFGFFFGIGHLIQWLWRVTVVDIFAFKPISFWQAWGLVLLSQILFKANVQPTTRTGRWRHDPACRESPETGPEQPLRNPEAGT
jgi:hypothetical protein